MSKNNILEYIESHKDEFITFFQKLIQTDSYNPPGNEKNLAIEIENYLTQDNLRCDVFEFEHNRANLIAYLHDDFSQKNLLFNGHMDIVPAGNEGDWKYPPLSAHNKRNKYIYGRGAADMKGGLTAMIIALKILKELQFEVNGNLILNAVADEETGGSMGTEWSINEQLKDINVDFAIVGEPTGLNPLPKAIILGERGHLQLKIIANGVSCHASMPNMGKNAIMMLTKLIQHINEIDDRIPEIKPPLSIKELKELISASFPSKDIFERILEDQELLRSLLNSLTTFTKSVTMIEGGIKENVVPDKCECIIDFRLLPRQNPKYIINVLKDLVSDLGLIFNEENEKTGKEPNIQFEIFHESEGSYWEEWRESKPLTNFYEIVENVYKKKPFYLLYPACADAHYLRNTGYCENTILFGPGSAATAHSVDEFIEVEDFLNAIRVYTLFAYEFLK
ncbi:MAG: ArgE/DapE family deacylase [Candidatus Lokiarchaeota archaeon]|nr:ArgE/DapE family deacylase [Candidatus Lokiarchaeota archaeon]MBD3201277.1 ArgE/DapE family deacylase [Candidatus Lokiarchaeota archaeon]